MVTDNVTYLIYRKAIRIALMKIPGISLQVQNTPGLVAEAQLQIELMDENDEAPIFTNIDSGTVQENEPGGAKVMTVTAIDNDGTYPNHKVTFALSRDNPREILEKFAINPNTGVVTTKQMFDRYGN